MFQITYCAEKALVCNGSMFLELQVKVTFNLKYSP